jgi:predicted DNA-binding protein (MmcQ/YjbR family)
MVTVGYIYRGSDRRGAHLFKDKKIGKRLNGILLWSSVISPGPINAETFRLARARIKGHAAFAGLRIAGFIYFYFMDLEQLRAFCLSLPGVTEDVKWGHDLCFSIGEKMFCVTGFEMPLKVTLKVSDEEFDELTASDHISPAPYLARHKWILVETSSRFSRTEWEHYITRSYELVRSKLPASKTGGKRTAAKMNRGKGRKISAKKKAIKRKRK